jgi:Tol biopolymer transport system component
VAYRANLTAGSGLSVKRSTGLEPEKRLAQVSGTEDVFPNSWSLDDRQILCMHLDPSGSRLELVPADGGKPTPFLPSKGGEANGMISPDGKWVAYASEDSGNWEIYATTFSGGAGKWQISRGGGVEPRWRADGKEVFYIAPTGMLMAVLVESGAGFSTGAPVPLFQVHARAPISSSDIFTYDVTKDGKRFLVNRYVKPDRIGPLSIVLNAGAE